MVVLPVTLHFVFFARRAGISLSLQPLRVNVGGARSFVSKRRVVSGSATNALTMRVTHGSRRFAVNVARRAPPPPPPRPPPHFEVCSHARGWRHEMPGAHAHSPELKHRCVNPLINFCSEATLPKLIGENATMLCAYLNGFSMNAVGKLGGLFL